MQNKKIWIDKLHGELDKQRGNLKLAYTFKKNGETQWSKRKTYFEVQSDDKLLGKINQRSILPNEIVLDLDQPERKNELIKRVKEDFDFYSIHDTGSKGIHTHLFFNEDLSKEEKESIIRKYGCDTQKASDSLIALEGVPHFKTGKPKTLLEEKKGFNNISKIKEEIKERRAKEERDKLRSFLKEDRKKFESLGCGYVNGVYYFGTKLFRDGQSFNVIVTSDKKIFIDRRIRIGKEIIGENEIKSLFGLNYKEEFYDESLDSIFSNKAVEKWVFENIEKITIKEVYKKLIKLFKKYIYLEDERKYSLLVCYRIASFFMPIWKVRARLFLYAEMGSAKSRLTQILHNTGFNSVSLGDWTLAYLKTIIESTRGETHIDDFETLPEDLKNATTRLVKVGYMRGFKAGKMSDGIKRKPEVNDLFNTTTLNNTRGLDFISYDRCITIRIPKISKKEFDKEPNFEESFWKDLRDELYILGLKYPEIVKETYEGIKSEKIGGRLLSIIKPELTIAKLISEDLYNDLENFWVEEIEQRDNIDYETDWEFLAYKKIYELLSPLSPNTLLSLNTPLSLIEFKLFEDVVKPIGLKLYGEEDFKKKKRSLSIVIGNSLSRNPIFKKRTLNGKKIYKVDIEEFKFLLDAKRFLKPILEILGLDESGISDSSDRGDEKMGKETNISGFGQNIIKLQEDSKNEQ